MSDESATGLTVETKVKLDLPLTLAEAARPLFFCDYTTLRNNLKALKAQGLPFVKRGRHILVYPSHVRAWDASRYTDAARRALRQGGFVCSDAAKLGTTTTR